MSKKFSKNKKWEIERGKDQKSENTCKKKSYKKKKKKVVNISIKKNNV